MSFGIGHGIRTIPDDDDDDGDGSAGGNSQPGHSIGMGWIGMDDHRLVFICNFYANLKYRQNRIIRISDYLKDKIFDSFVK